MRNMTIRTVRSALVAATAAFALSMPVQAQQDRDGRWMAFVGCWEAVGAEEDLGLLCFDFDDDGVLLTNHVGGEIDSTERLVADGQQRTVSVEGCEGWETLEFSADGRRAFTQTEFFCGTDDARSGTGVMTFIAPNRWADVRALDVGGEQVAWVQEYQLVGTDRLAEMGIADPAEGLGMAVRSSRMAAAAPIDLSDVEEALERIDERAVETWIVAQQDRLDPSADDLVRLADAGAPERVIDAVVAVSHPDRFIAEASGPIEQVQDDAPRPTHYRGYMAYNPYMLGWSMRYGGFGYGYSPFRYGYYGSPFGYSGYGYGYGYGSRPYSVIIERRQSSGQIRNGRGYVPGGRPSTGRAAQPRGGSAQPSFSTGGSRPSAGAPSTGSRPKSTPRKAKRRPPGG